MIEHTFFNPNTIEDIVDSPWKPIKVPMLFLLYTFIILLFVYTSIYYIELFKDLRDLKIYNIVTLGMFIYMLLFAFRPSGKRPFNKKFELYFIIKNIGSYFAMITLLFVLINFIFICHCQSIFSPNFNYIKESLHLTIIWLFLPFSFTYILNRFFIDIPYKYFLNIHTSTIKGVDLFTSTKQITKHHRKDDIYIDIIQQTKLPDSKIAEKDYLKIQTMYLRLIKFWYAQKNYTFKLRYYFPIFISIISLVYFFYLLDFIHEIQKNSSSIEGIQSMGAIGISLTVLYFTMSHHINSFLHSEFYTSSILKELNKVYFDKHNHKQQLKLFLDKNFLIYIHDKKHDTHFCVNESKDFQDFISTKKADEEGRNLIIMVYISFFMILFIETSTGDLLGLDNNETNTSKTTITISYEKKEKQ